jgi:hypothetical protein
MKQKLLLALGVGLMTTALSSNAAVMLFGNNSSGLTYTEAGMTITATSAEPVRTNGTWFLDCCDAGPETFSLATGGLFDLQSIFIGHVDGSDPVVWKGYLGVNELVSTSFNSGQGSTFNFAGFTGLDRVTMSVSGRFTDPNFDNLTFQAAATQVPEPASLALLGIGLAGLSAMRRRQRA